MEPVLQPYFVLKKMRASKNAIALIKSFEGCKLEAYLDPVGIPTIGYGTTGPGIVEGLTITQGIADGMLLDHIKEVSEQVSHCVGFSPSQNEFDALVAFTYNLGIGNLKSSTLLKKLKAGDKAGAADEFLKWNKAGKKVLPGLTRRREAERALFLGSQPEVGSDRKA